MKPFHFTTRRALPRRAFLRGLGVTLTLPWLEAMRPAFAAADKSAPRRFVSVVHGLGFHAPDFIPAQTGLDYEAPLYLRTLADLRARFTVLSGLSHPEVGGGHNSESSFLTAAPYSGTAAYRNTQSLDQLMAERLGAETRFASLVLSANHLATSYTPSGAMIPPEQSPSKLFTKLFVTGTADEQRAQLRRARAGRSVLDAVAEDTRRLQRDLGPGDRDKLEAWLTNVRAVEQRLATGESWAAKPKPHVGVPPPRDIADVADLAGRERAMLEVMALALQTDSTRFITLHLQGGAGVPPIAGVAEGHHNLSHHGLDDGKITQLRLIEAALIAAVGDFLRRLRDTAEGGASVLDHTTVLLGSNLGNASNHDTKNLPILVAGGGFKHAGHLAFDRARNEPLANLYVSILQRTGLEQERFASSTGTLRGLAAGSL